MALTHYEVLRVAPDADLAAIRAAYRRRARETHPDTGGDADEFAAVALAWWTLSDPDRRSAYDAGDDADGDDWGEDLGWDDVPERPAARPEHEEPQPDAREHDRPGPDHPPMPEPVPDPVSDAGPAPAADVPPTAPPGPGAPVDALTSAPRVLPDPPPTPGPSPRWGPDGRLPMLGGAAVVLVLVGCIIGVPALTAGDVSSGAWAGVVMYAAALTWSLWYRTRVPAAGRRTRAWAATLVWGSVAVYALMGAGYLSELVSGTRLAFVLAPLAAGIAVALASGRRLRRKRAALADQEVARRQRSLARRWNRLLAVREAHGAADVVAGVSGGRAVWLLVDGAGATLDRAPATAPLAWARLLRTVGVDVAPVPRPRPAREPRDRPAEPATP